MQHEDVVNCAVICACSGESNLFVRCNSYCSVDMQDAALASRAGICAASGEINLFVRRTWCVDIQHAVIKDRAVIFASSGEGGGSLLCRC